MQFADEIDYWQRRERAERAAAKCATHLASRRIHQELAFRYATLVATAAPPAP